MTLSPSTSRLERNAMHPNTSAPVTGRRSRREPPDGPELPKGDRLWTVQEAAEFLGLAVATLHQWRYVGSGPAAYLVGGRLRYDPLVVRRWVAENCASPRSA